MILAGDIGGTKTALALYGEGSGPGNPAAEETFPSRDYTSLAEIVDVFLDKVRPDRVDAACFAVAGPILGGRASITNLPWTVQHKVLSAFLKVNLLRLINDVQAVACSVPFLAEGDLHTLSAGRPEVDGTVAVIAPGTGLGQAFLTWDGKSYHSHPTEGGHADFGPGDAKQSGLLTFMRTRRDHVSWETVCSGMGIPNIYDYLKSTGDYGKAGLEEAAAPPGTDRTPSIIRAALDETSPDPICADALEMFISILGAEAGNLALKTMATGGLYVGGGIPPRILGAIREGAFMESFTAKGRLKPMMEEIPVHIILNPKAALMGAATEAFRMIRDLRPQHGG